mgnify:CR=1 FL=1
MNEKVKKFFHCVGALFVCIFAFILGRKLSDNRDRDTTNRDALDRLGEASDRIEGNTKDIRDILAEVRKRKVED